MGCILYRYSCVCVWWTHYEFTSIHKHNKDDPRSIDRYDRIAARRQDGRTSSVAVATVLYRNLSVRRRHIDRRRRRRLLRGRRVSGVGCDVLSTRVIDPPPHRGAAACARRRIIVVVVTMCLCVLFLYNLDLRDRTRTSPDGKNPSAAM